jgi:hypothetical protein
MKTFIAIFAIISRCFAVPVHNKTHLKIIPGYLNWAVKIVAHFYLQPKASIKASGLGSAKKISKEKISDSWENYYFTFHTFPTRTITYLYCEWYRGTVKKFILNISAFLDFFGYEWVLYIKMFFFNIGNG